MKEQGGKKKKERVYPNTDIIGQTYDFIMDGTIADEAREGVSDEEIEQANELINPDPDSMDARG